MKLCSSDNHYTTVAKIPDFVIAHRWAVRPSRVFNGINPLSANPTKWSDTLGQYTRNFLNVFDHFAGLALKGLKVASQNTSNCSDCFC